MMHNDGCSKRRRVALILATIWLSGCATGASDVVSLGACPPVVEFSRMFQTRAAKELALLPEGSVIVDMLADYSVMRAQIRMCARGWMNSVVSNWASRISNNDGAGVHVARDDASRSNDRSVSNSDARKDHGAPANPDV
ncbi:hypothetical protein Wenmar_01801 [Wenxinia marina DSM 24838]|uniref:Lipoprotein n=1 Tax=Wenxinia marina DSM 24838 TaxID=1123501 RepID=A0A0D0Q4H3_9RHOB|nr:hypothetical protein Wenmar_01801 [Wenxinia marina DSM 24838]